MPFIVFIGGVPNAGKSTIAAGLACAIPNTEFIDGDFVLSEEEEQVLEGFPLPEKWEKRLEKIVTILRGKTAKGHNVTVAWPLSQDGYDYLKTVLQTEIEFYYVFLNPALDSLKQNRATRPLTAWDEKRGHEMHAEKYPAQGFCSLVLDTTNHLPFDTIQAIRQQLLDKIL